VKLSLYLGLGKLGMKDELTIGILLFPPPYMPAPEPPKGTLDALKPPGNGLDLEKGFGLFRWL
jgi:hypothetical protein